MKKEIIVIWVPAALGVLLLLVVAIDLHQFKAGATEVNVLLARELPIVVLGCFSTLGVFMYSFVWLFHKQWAFVFQAALSISVFVSCFMAGGEIGGAFLNAT